MLFCASYFHHVIHFSPFATFFHEKPKYPFDGEKVHIKKNTHTHHTTPQTQRPHSTAQRSAAQRSTAQHSTARPPLLSPSPSPHTHTHTHHTITEPSHTTGLWSSRQSGTDNRRKASMGCDESEHGWVEATGSDGTRHDEC